MPEPNLPGPASQPIGIDSLKELLWGELNCCRVNRSLLRHAKKVSLIRRSPTVLCCWHPERRISTSFMAWNSVLGPRRSMATVTVQGHELSMTLTKSKQRIADHGEVFTPAWMVEAMLDLVKGESERIDSRFLEPACGSGNFLVRILKRKLVAVELKFGKSDFEKRQYAVLALMCTYGIELLADNIAECRANMLEVFADYLDLEQTADLYRAAWYVLSQNLVHGDALTMLTDDGQPINFAEWGYLGKGKFQRRDFRFEALTHMSSFSQEGTLFAHLGKHEVFTPLRAYPPMTVRELACLAPSEIWEQAI